MNKGLFEGVIIALWQGCKPAVGNHSDKCADLQNHASYPVLCRWMGTRRPQAFPGQLSPAAEGNVLRAWAPPGAEVPAVWSWCPPLHLWCPEVVTVLKGTCPEVRPDVSSCLLQPVTGARLSPQCFPQSRPTSMASGWQLAVPGHFSCHSLKVKPRGLISPVVKRPCNGTAFTNNHWYCHEAESTQRVDSTSSNYQET